MYTYNQIKSLSLEISSRCQASCPMCARNYHGEQENPLLPINDISVELFTQICSPDFIKQLSNITMCGNFGDPIVNSDLLSITQYIKTHNPDIRIEIDTNGSARSTAWWIKLAHLLPKNHVVSFGIDGLEDTHSTYRIGTNFRHILENARAFILAGGNARWNFITFKHNEHQLEECRKLAKEMGFDSFYEKQTSRFIGKKEYDVLDSTGAVCNTLYPPTEHRVAFINKETLDNYKSALASATIDCEVEHTKTIHIDAQGRLWPCSFTAGMPYIFSKPEELVYNFVTDARSNFESFVNDKFGGMDQFDLRKHTIEEIVNSDAWQTAWNEAFKNNSVHVCTRTCGKFKDVEVSQCRDQFLDLQDLNE